MPGALHPSPTRKRFGEFEYDGRADELRRNGGRVRLQDQPLQILAILLERPGEVVSRDGLRERLWPADTFVDFDHSLNTAIKKLRQALGDSADNPVYIETLARKGYRFIAPVTDAEPAQPANAPIVPGAASLPRTRPRRLTIPALAGILLIAMSVMWWRVARSSSPLFEPRAGASARSADVAVLPLRILTSDPSERYLGVGIADAVTAYLSNARALKVRPTTAVLKYENASTDPKRAAEELDVEHVLVGTLQRSHDTFRATVQLIRAADGLAVWGRTYDIERKDLFRLEDALAEQVAAALRVVLSADARARMQKQYTTNVPAYETYLQGRALMLNYSEVRMKAAIESYEHALSIDPGYALARAGLATALAWFSVRYAYDADAQDWGRRAEEEATRALAQDASLAEAHVALANAAGTLHGGFNWDRVLEELEVAVAIDPNVELAHLGRARALYHLGLFDAANAAATKAMSLGAPNVEIDRLLLAIALFGGRFDEARDRAARLVQQTDAPIVATYYGQALFYLGEREAGLGVLESAKRGGRPDVRSRAALAGLHAAMDHRLEAERILSEIAAGGYMDHHVAYSIGAAYAQLDRTADAAKWLRTAVDTGFPCYSWYMSDPLLAPVRRRPEIVALLDDLHGRHERALTRFAGTAPARANR